MGPLVRMSQGCNQGVGWAVFPSGGLVGQIIPFQLHSVCWKDSFPCVCRAEDLGFMLVFGWRPPSALRGCP